jgi:DNA adenine methylase
MTTVYLDPPYPDNKCNYAHNVRSWDDHANLAERLGLTKCKWIMSSYDVPEVHTFFGTYHIIPVQSYSGMNINKGGSERVLNREVLIANFVPDNMTLFEHSMPNVDDVQ